MTDTSIYSQTIVLRNNKENPDAGVSTSVSTRLLELAEIANFQPDERSVYEESLKDYRDLRSAVNTYYRGGIAEGKTEEKQEIAIKLLQSGSPIEFIAKITGLPVEKVETLQQ